MAVGEIYVAKMFSSYLGEQMLNQFYYEQVSENGNTDAFGCWSAFDNDILAAWVGTISDTIVVSNVEVFQILDGADFHSQQPSNNTGLRVIASNAAMPSSVAFSYRSNRAGAGSRRTYKRFSGISELDVSGNALSAAFLAITAVGDLETALGTDIQGGVASVYKPIQVKAGWKVGFAPTKNFDITLYDSAVLSTQNSRKP